MWLSAKKRRGIAATELAVLAPFFAFLFVVGLDFCRIFYTSQIIANCARNGAFYQAAITGNTWEGGATDYTTATAAAKADGSNLTPALTDGNVTFTSGTDADSHPYVRCTVTYNFKFIGPSSYSFYGQGSGGFTVTRTVQMRSAPSTPDP